MGSRLSYRGDKKDQDIIDLCQKLILSCVPNYKTIRFSSIEEQSLFFQALSQDQIDSALSSEKWQFRIYLEILQRCNIAYNDPELIVFIESLLHDKTFFALNKKGIEKRLFTKKLIDRELKKHLLKVSPSGEIIGFLNKLESFMAFFKFCISNKLNLIPLPGIFSYKFHSRIS